MLSPKLIPALCVLVALALSTGAPPFIHALERPPDIAIQPGDYTGSVSSGPPMVQDDGDPDDWASRSDDESSGGGQNEQLGGSGAEWDNYKHAIRGLILRIKIALGGIL